MTTPAAKVSRTSAANPRVGPHPGMLLAVAYLGAGILGYLLVGPTHQGSSLPVLWAAIAIAAVTATVLNRSNPLPPTVAPWVCPAIVGPLALYPIFGPVLALDSAAATAFVAVLLLASTLPMVIAIVRLPPGDHGNLARAAVPALGLGTFFLVIVPVAASNPGLATASAPIATPASTAGWAARLLVLAVLTWPPAVAFTVLLRRQRPQGTRPAGEVLGDAALLVAAVGPVVTASVLLIPWMQALPLIGLAALLLFAASRVAVRPLAAISARAAAQRDLAVTTSEAERARLAADLHDGPLQDLLLLARSLEARNDPDGARLARDVADELREVSGDLRLPVLDDLGTGPALDWLAARVRRLTGLDVATEWDADGRPPGQVELAAFRIAQEAVSNAVRHGRPPIRVRCRSTADGLRLTIEDAGDGRGLDALTSPTAPGGMRRGMLGMAQRAEQIGATLDVRRGEGRGTIVVLEWGSPTA
jgi:signal transduction histidine kinase